MVAGLSVEATSLGWLAFCTLMHVKQWLLPYWHGLLPFAGSGRWQRCEWSAAIDAIAACRSSCPSERNAARSSDFARRSLLLSLSLACYGRANFDKRPVRTADVGNGLTPRFQERFLNGHCSLSYCLCVRCCDILRNKRNLHA